jgi:lipid-binding SYLF domain-containing protein
MRHAKTFAALTSLLALTFLTACNQVPTTSEIQKLQLRSDGARHDFETANPTLKQYFATSHGYAIFPAVNSAAIGVGGSYGQGVVYENGSRIGTADVTGVNVGLALGGQRFAEVIFFQNQSSFAAFKTGTLEFDARASAVAASTGTGTSVDYVNGVRVFTQTEGGLMFQASIGGQKFRFMPSNP